MSCRRLGWLSLGLLLSPAVRPTVSHAQATLEARAAEGNGAPETLALSDEQLTIRIDRQYAETNLRHTFTNGSDTRLEGQYRLRAQQGAEVQQFAYWNGEEKIVGEVFEKQDANRIYDNVTGTGRDPGLLERTGEGSFAFKIFPIEAHEQKRVEVTLHQWMKRSGGAVEYRVPLGSDNHRIVVELHDERAIAHLQSSTHALTTERLPNGSYRLRAAPQKGQRQFVLRWEPTEPPLLLSAAKHKDAGQDGYVAMQLVAPPSVQQARAPKDVTIVLDHSGSMNGEPLAQAKLAAEEIADALVPGDKVNVISFDDGADRLFARPQPVTDETRRQTLSYLRAITPAGGTDIALALRLALASQTPEPGRSALILFLTDGQSPTAPVFEALRNDRSATRVFTVGLGHGVDRALLQKLAEQKRGRFTYVESAAAIRPEVTRLWKSLEEPVLTDLQLEASGGVIKRIYPKTIADLAPGEELLVVARVASEGPMSVKLTGQMGGKPVQFSTVVDGKKDESRPWVGRLWAEERVRDLLAEVAFVGESAELKQETIDLALAYDLVTPYTSFLAIPETELSGATKQLYASAKQRKADRLAAHPDAIALSRNAMPPGDPILLVKAPRDAKQVTATFPFGLVKDLVYDETTGCWKTRFLVPNTVADGHYYADVVVIHADGAREDLMALYKIDSKEPAFDVKLEKRAGGLWVVVDTAEEVRECQAMLVGTASTRIVLQPVGAVGKGRFAGMLPTHADLGTVRVVVADTARNEAIVEVGIE